MERPRSVRGGGLAWRLAAAFVAVTATTLAIVLVVLDRLTASAFGDYVGHVEMMRTMMRAAPALPDPAVFTDRVQRALLLAGIGGTIVAAAAGLVISRRLTRPLRAMERAARAIAAGDTGVRVPLAGEGELGLLAASFNTMAASLAASSEARKQFLAGVAHELRTPLSVLQGEIEALQDGVIEPGPDRLEALAEEVRLLGRVVGDLQMLSLADAGELRLERAPEPAVTLLVSAVTAVQEATARRGVQVTLDAREPLPAVFVDHERIAQVLRNLLANAVRYAPPGGVIRVVARRDGAAVRVAVEDTGPGIAAADLPRVFDRFYRAPSTAGRAGSGLGLAIVRELVMAHGGTVHAENLPGAGARFEFTLPIAPATAGAAGAAPAAALTTAGSAP